MKAQSTNMKFVLKLKKNECNFQWDENQLTQNHRQNMNECLNEFMIITYNL